MVSFKQKEVVLKKMTDAVTQVELKTTGELVPAVFGKSDSYEFSRHYCALASGLLVGLSLATFMPSLSAVWVVLAEIPALALGYVLGKSAGITRLLTTDAQMQAAVERRAQQVFFEQGLHETEGRTGILIFVSLLERRAVLLADRGINALAGPQGELWKKIMHDLTESLAQGRADEGMVHAIQACGAVLSEHFPAKSKNPNELSNHAIWRSC